MTRVDRWFVFAVFVLMLGFVTGCSQRASPSAPTVPAASSLSGSVSTPLPALSPTPFISPTSPTTSTPDLLQAIINELQGLVEAARAQGEAFVPATLGMVIVEQGQVQTGEESKATLDVSDGVRVRLGPLTLFTLEKAQQSDQGLWAQIKLEFGEIWVMLFGEGMIQIETPMGEAAVRGSFLNVGYDPVRQVVFVTCLEGNCMLANQAGRFDLVSGQAAEMTSSEQPPMIGRMNEMDVQRWMEINPEATAVLPIMQATMTALPPMPVMPPHGMSTPVPGVESIPFLECLNTPGACVTYCGQMPIPQDCREFFAAMQQLGLDGRSCFNAPDPAACVEQLLNSLPPVPTASLEGVEHVPLPSLSCMEAGEDCDAYCSQDPPPADCTAFVQTLEAYGIDIDEFIACVGEGPVISPEDVQRCADQLAGLSP